MKIEYQIQTRMKSRTLEISERVISVDIDGQRVWANNGATVSEYAHLQKRLAQRGRELASACEQRDEAVVRVDELNAKVDILVNRIRRRDTDLLAATAKAKELEKLEVKLGPIAAHAALSEEGLVRLEAIVDAEERAEKAEARVKHLEGQVRTIHGQAMSDMYRGALAEAMKELAATKAELAWVRIANKVRRMFDGIRWLG